MAIKPKGHYETTYVYDPVSGIDKPQSIWVEDEPVIEPKPKPKPKPEISTLEPTQEVDAEGVPIVSTEPLHQLAEPTGVPCDAEGTPCSISGKPQVSVKPMEVTPAPPYEISPEQAAWQEQYGGKLSDWVEAEGYGIPEDIKAQMIQQQTDVLKAREQESIRVMRNNMERRGITNSGFVFDNEQKIRSGTTVAIADSIRDIQIKSALMKLASFEKAMGAAGQFLGYLSEQSQLKYQPEFATWQAEQMAKMQAWQARIDFQKLALMQAYQQQNIILTGQIQQGLQDDQQEHEIVVAEMTIEANQQAAAAEGAGSLWGTVLGFLAMATL